MEAKINQLIESVSSFFTSGDQIPWCERDIVLGCEKEVAEAAKGDSEEQKAGSIMRLSWALVHSRQQDDVKRGIAMLEVLLVNKSNTAFEEREKLYFLAVGNYRSGEFSKSRKLLEKCLHISPDWNQALTLKKMVEEQITKDGVIGIGITAGTVGLIVSGFVAALVRR